MILNGDFVTKCILFVKHFKGSMHLVYITLYTEENFKIETNQKMGMERGGFLLPRSIF